MHFVSVSLVVHLCSCIDTATAWKKSRFILSIKSDFHMIVNLSIIVHSFARRVLTSIAVDEILLPGYVNLSTNLRGLPFRMEMAPRLKHK